MTTETDINLVCPHCGQPLECSAEIIGVEVNCPVCGGPFALERSGDDAQPAQETPVRNEVKLWTVDVRVLIPRMPPAYYQILAEVPLTWVLPQEDPAASQPVFAAVTQAIKIKYPNSPVTPISVHDADSESSRRCSGQPDFSNDRCRVWLLGRRNVA